MNYLEEKGIVHRDLAARNVLGECIVNNLSALKMQKMEKATTLPNFGHDFGMTACLGERDGGLVLGWGSDRRSC